MGERRRALRRTSDRTLQQVLDALGLVDGQWAAIESGKIANPRVIVVARSPSTTALTSERS